MALEVTNLTRKFIFEKGKDKINLADPNPQFSIAEVSGFYASQHPELTNATISGPEINNDTAVYTFKTTIGTKG